MEKHSIKQKRKDVVKKFLLKSLKWLHPELGMAPPKSESLIELEKDSLSFWDYPLELKGQPFNSLQRKQILIQLKRQFKINPREWRYKGDCWEGHWHEGIENNDRVEKASGSIINRRTGKELSMWLDWTSSCEKTDKTFAACSHKSPKECGIRFYIYDFGNVWLKPGGLPKDKKDNKKLERFRILLSKK
jgi:hypothetical protein